MAFYMNESVRGSESSPSAEGKPMQKCGTMRRMVNYFAATLGDAPSADEEGGEKHE